MQIDEKRRTTYTVNKVLDIMPPDLGELRSRGVYYRSDMDEVAYEAARVFYDQAIIEIRRRAKDETLPVELGINMRDGRIEATVSATVVRL